MTAVTTAGLLAGLFGSAFVPAARAAVDTANDATQTASYTAASATDATYAYYTTTAFPVFTIDINADDDTTAPDDDGTYSVTIAGGTIRSCTLAAINAATVVVGSVVSSTTSCSAALAFTELAATAGAEARWTVTLNKLTAGQTVTTTVADDDTATLSTSSRKIRGITAASLATISAVHTDAVDAGGDSDFVTTVASLWTLGYEELGVVQVDLKNVYDADPSIFPLVEARITGPMSVAATTDNDCDAAAVPLASYGSSSTALSAADTADDINVCVISTDEDSTSAGVGTLTIIAGGVTVLTQRINMIGDATSIVLTQNMKHFAVGATLDSEATFSVAKLTYKDAAGNTLTASDFDASVDFSINGVATALADAGTGTTFDAGAGNGADGYVGLGNICAGKESGDTVKIDVEYENIDEDLVTGSFTMTCTDADGKITNIKMAASSANPGSDVKVNLTVVDSEGRACGYGCTIPNATLVTRTPVGEDDTDTLTNEAGDAVLTATHLTGALFGANLVDGTAWVKIQTPSTKGTYAAIIDYDDIETGGAVALPGSWTIRLVSSDVAAAPSSTGLTRSAKKLVATADFGATAGGAKIAFTLERSNGTVKTYYRKANADGVATFRLRFSGKYEVTASYGDYITDTVILRKR